MGNRKDIYRRDLLFSVGPAVVDRRCGSGIDKQIRKGNSADGDEGADEFDNQIANSPAKP